MARPFPIRSLTILSLAASLAACAGALRQEIYQADARPVTIAAFTQRRPETMRVMTRDGLALAGYYWPGDPADRDVLLFFHGRGSNQGIAARYAERLTGAGDHVVVVSYRGFGGNPGRPDEAGLIEDGRAFVARARAMIGPQARLYLIGHSLGGAVAMHVAADGGIAGVFALSAFDRLAGSAPAGIGPLLPDAWDNVAAAGRIAAPIVLFHGSADPRVSQRQADALFAAVRAPALSITIPGEGHHPDMTRIAPVIQASVRAIDDGRFPAFPAPLPAGWIARRTCAANFCANPVDPPPSAAYSAPSPQGRTPGEALGAE